jgi:hypothetical protein
LDRAEILARARAAKKKKASNAPLCGDCRGSTIQNGPEKRRGRFWCDKCGWYPDDIVQVPKRTPVHKTQRGWMGARRAGPRAEIYDSP